MCPSPFHCCPVPVVWLCSANEHGRRMLALKIFAPFLLCSSLGFNKLLSKTPCLRPLSPSASNRWRQLCLACLSFYFAVALVSKRHLMLCTANSLYSHLLIHSRGPPTPALRRIMVGHKALSSFLLGRSAFAVYPEQ